ncbi:hydrogenase maturation protease [Methylomonas methanica]|uniref:Hydrogenase maturation protease n=1 Tax=Methylomonas methanica (strain DSM 25384 / MC09) TaxID=857087 RepID=F9ZZN6_METMM|nr:hydrogenase maturation protease [Methylomonas methanica]AEF98695.1 hydrogenase maturation protease [Methylomonas methanica MC09]
MTKPILVFGYGNLSRGDDAVGPLLLAYLEQHADLSRIELLTDFQLQIEHALDLQDRALVIFVDAAVCGDSPFGFSRLAPCHDNSYTSHAMSPAALLQVFESVTGDTMPPSFLLSIKTESFELGDGLSESARNNLHEACRFAENILERPIVEILDGSVKSGHLYTEARQ